MTNATATFVSLFVDVPGTVIGGWVGFGLFIALAVLTGALALSAGGANSASGMERFYETICYCIIMMIVYLLTAMEQFVFARDNHDNVNLLMVITGAVVWQWAVMRSARRLDVRPLPVFEQYAFMFGAISQVLFVLSAFVWDGAVYALYSIGVVLMLVALAHYIFPIVHNWARVGGYSRTWLAFSLVYTVLYVVIALLSHLYLAVISLSGAVWAYLAMHLLVYVWLFVSSYNVRALFVGGTLVVTPPHGSASAAANLSATDGTRIE